MAVSNESNQGSVKRTRRFGRHNTAGQTVADISSGIYPLLSYTINRAWLADWVRVGWLGSSKKARLASHVDSCCR